MNITLNDLQELASLNVGDGFDGWEVIEKGLEPDEHRWFFTYGIILKHNNKYYSGYYYGSIKSESMGVIDIEPLDTKVDLVEVFPYKKLVTEWSTAPKYNIGNVILSDDDGHQYIIPIDKMDEFYSRVDDEDDMLDDFERIDGELIIYEYFNG
jgi:hypothetical protein